jgi:uncharacterized membrane protein YgcG
MKLAIIGVLSLFLTVACQNKDASHERGSTGSGESMNNGNSGGGSSPSGGGSGSTGGSTGTP